MADAISRNTLRSENATSYFEFETLPTVAIVLMRTNSIFIVSLNAIVIACLIVGKTKFPEVYWIQVLSLSINDMIAGCSVFLTSFINSQIFSKHIQLCSLTMAFFISSQSATLYSIAIICAYRFVIAKKINQVTVNVKKHKVAILAACTWPVSLVSYSIPFALWTRKDNVVVKQGCSIENALQDNLEKLAKFTFIFFVLPLLFTNIMYCGVFMLLHRSWNTIQPSSCLNIKTNSSYTDRNSAPGTSSSTNELIIPQRSEKSYVSEKMDVSKKSMFPKNARIVLGAVKTVRAFQNSHRQILPKTSNEGQKQSQVKRTTHADSKLRCEGIGQSKATDFTKTGFKSTNASPVSHEIAYINGSRQRKAYILLGFILLFLNLFTVPGLLVMIMETKMKLWATHGTKIVLFTAISCNAWVNPVLYTIQVREFRIILKSLCVQCYFKTRSILRRQTIN